MSTSDLYILNKKSTRHFAEFRNGWGSAPLAWDFLAEKYLSEFNLTDYMHPDYIGSSRKWEMVWKLASDTKLKLCERIVLMITFDRAFVPKQHLKEAGEACNEFYGMTAGTPGFENHANHWGAIGQSLIQMSKQRLSQNARGACLSCTSVNDIWIDPSDEQLSGAWPIFAESAEEPA